MKNSEMAYMAAISRENGGYNGKSKGFVKFFSPSCLLFEATLPNNNSFGAAEELIITRLPLPD